MSWELATKLDALSTGPVLYKHSPKQIAIFRIDDQVFAVDNRCPHEGYPLVQGKVDDNCLLTCNWHNWKFHLQDGKCVLGGDDVRSYAVRVDDDEVYVDFSDPPPKQIELSVLKGLENAFDERDFGRICREISRLHFNQLEPLTAVRKAIEWSHDRFGFGMTHAYAAAADWLSEAERNQSDWERRLICLAETVDHMAFDALRHKRYPYAQSASVWSVTSFLEAVETEQREVAEATVLGGLDDGLHWEDMEESFATSALAHFNDFGHSLIYVCKAGQLIGHLGTSIESFVIPSLARSVTFATREDLLPEFKDYSNVLEALPPPAEAENGTLAGEALFPASVRKALSWVQEHIGQHQPIKLYKVLLESLARNLLHYDTSYQSAFDRPVSESVNWLSLTHGVTFANAVRVICERYPKLLPQGLLQMACFVGRNHRFLDLKLDEQQWQVDDSIRFFEQARELILDHGLRDPIFSAHLLKTTLAVEEELSFATPACQKYLLAGLNRFLNSPLKQKHVRRLARQAIDLVKRDF